MFSEEPALGPLCERIASAVIVAKLLKYVTQIQQNIGHGRCSLAIS